MKNKKKTILKRVSALLCTMIVGIGALVGASPYYALDLPSEVNNYENYVVVKRDYGSSADSIETQYVCLMTNENFYYTYYDSGATKYICVKNGAKAVLFPDKTEWEFRSSAGDYCVQPNYYMSYDVYTIIDSNCPIYSDSTCAEVETPVGGSSGGTYKADLGYLQNVSQKETFLTDTNGNSSMETLKKKINFSTTSSMGVDLTSGDYVVRVYGQMAFWKNGTSTLVNDDFPLVHFADYDASSGSLSYIVQELFDKVSENSENPYNAFDNVFGQIVRSDNAYLQIYNTSTGEYGGYVKLSFVNVDGEDKMIATTVDNELNDDSSGYIGKDVPTSVGSGTNYDDAELNAKPVGNNSEDLNGLEDTLNEYVSTMGDIPKAIAIIFSFLPPWCLGLFGLSFSLMAILIIYKLVRG